MTLRVLFYLPVADTKNIQWDGHSIRDGGVGVSGSHQSFVAAAEQVARLVPGAQVSFLNIGSGRTANGVTYLQNGSAAEVEAVDAAEVLVIPSWMPHCNPHALQQPGRFRSVRHFVVWFQCQYCDEPLQTLMRNCTAAKPNARWHWVHLSTWSHENVVAMGAAAGLLGAVASHARIPNPLLSDTLPPLGDLDALRSRPARDFVFHACFERGGDVARRVHTLIQARNPGQDWGRFVDCAYYDAARQLDKRRLFGLLAGCRYFVYPLVLPAPRSIVHRDTFGCVVAEALALGVEVISYPVGALPELYPGMIKWIPFPACSPYSTEYFNLHRAGDRRAPELGSDAQVAVIAELVEQLDATYESRAEERLRHAREVRTMYHMEDAVGARWAALITELSREP